MSDAAFPTNKPSQLPPTVAQPSTNSQNMHAKLTDHINHRHESWACSINQIIYTINYWQLHHHPGKAVSAYEKHAHLHKHKQSPSDFDKLVNESQNSL